MTNAWTPSQIILVQILQFIFIQAMCKDPEVPLNGHIDSDSLEIMYICDSGYYLSGRQLNYCNRANRWAFATPKCEPVECPVLPLLENGTFSPSNQTTYKTRVVFTCLEPYIPIPVTSSEIVCEEDGNWNAEPPTCMDPRCERPSNGVLQVTEIEKVNSTRPGGKILFSCPPTHLLNPYYITEAECQITGFWEPQHIPHCEGRIEYKKFKVLDKDGSDGLDQKEFGSQTKVFHDYDVDDDNRLDYEEFKKYLDESGSSSEPTDEDDSGGKIGGGVAGGGAIAAIVVFAGACAKKKRSQGGGQGPPRDHSRQPLDPEKGDEDKEEGTEQPLEPVTPDGTDGKDGGGSKEVIPGGGGDPVGPIDGNGGDNQTSFIN